MLTSTAGVANGEIVKKGISWYVPYNIANVVEKISSNDHIVTTVATDLSHIRNTVFPKPKQQQTERDLELKVGSGNDLPFFSTVGFQRQVRYSKTRF